MAYSSLLICWIMIMINIVDSFGYHQLIIMESLQKISTIFIVCFGLIYHKLHTIPITEAISKWWEKRKDKSENRKVEDVEIKTYQDYKEQNNKK